MPTSSPPILLDVTPVPPSWCHRCGWDHARPLISGRTCEAADADCERWIRPQPLTLTQVARRAAGDVINAVALDPARWPTTTSPELLDAIAVELRAWAQTIRLHQATQERVA